MARITVDLTAAFHQSAGIGRLTREVTRALVAHPDGHRYRFFVMGRPANPAARLALTAFGTQHGCVVAPLTDRWLHRLWFKARLPLPVEWFAGGTMDLYHATDFVLPPTLPGRRTVLTVHDLTFERDPESAVPALLAFLRRVVPASARRASHIVADSHATARDLRELYGIPQGKITTIHSGVEARFFAAPQDGSDADADAAVRAKYGVGPGPFVLCVGTLQKRKNHLGVVRAFAAMGPQDARLVIAGGKGWLYDEVHAEVRALGLDDRVRFTGFVDDADLPALYRAARVFAFPSLYEGFGLPLLEAMATGTPVVTSNVSSLPEVAGDVGLQVVPTDVPALAAALRTAFSNQAWRADQIPRGIARARTFTWQQAAASLREVYDEVLAQS